ncbi:PE-PPE domain-containing protein OS=Tsukamurella paurometabola (strain ATCC 8368 / DSM / CCUG 35730 / CIP 100753 / JCM 10117 / KCTC 9821 / NBRC 16120 /NCIMB 702349 / NCTC 13040) OX=521096 GN=Tpau_2213 PE=4 SV=1 [Tsukamurella paurometabola]|uniref:PE-PPE domain-containing protein n=1 Tax=Tsukamurella paurometabola (strain ATCC 8368 / DSM 20162 / CCUG 35730 / CIP 100753 / JCM 10117 / KCTC 9821 / NBRC 16120 / NCIMB 702349 / NCTC 13040) TaxID=521096 RepID=D5UPR6_TSUPD|nr:PE-PPE domain-containing protein [Tsukamurella paurometabola]ADG78822.1 hypothetical protein Tpau_2213 [Tsukamurella paurometabola DSM 20162]SUP33244.1 PE-PPE domain [Tsukamurella paurometabola]
MSSSHRRPAARTPGACTCVAAAGAGLVGAFLLAGPASGLLAQAAAKTIVVVGGANDPTGKDQWARIGRDHSGTPPVFVPYSAQFGIGWPGLALSQDRRTTYAQSVDEGANATVKAVEAAAAHDDEVVVYTISQGADVVGLAVIRYGKDHPAPSGGGGPRLTFVEQGGPSFIRTGMWNVIPAGVPGLHTGPIRNDGASGATVVGICIKGDIACGVGNPVSSVFYAFPGFMLHGSGYTAEYIGRYSPVHGGEPYTPGSQGEVPVRVETVRRDGRTVTESIYADGSSKRSWTEDGTTWVVIDTGENPWMRLLRSTGTPVPTSLDAVLNRVIPVPEPGAVNPWLPPEEPVRAVPAAAQHVPSTLRHGMDRSDALPVADLLRRSNAGGAERPAAEPPRADPVTDTDSAVAARDVSEEYARGADGADSDASSVGDGGGSDQVTPDRSDGTDTADSPALQSDASPTTAVAA